jgi:hypothetical protein
VLPLCVRDDATITTLLLLLLLLSGRQRQDEVDVEDEVGVVGVENGENKNKNFWSADTLGWHSSRHGTVIHKNLFLNWAFFSFNNISTFCLFFVRQRGRNFVYEGVEDAFQIFASKVPFFGFLATHYLVIVNNVGEATTSTTTTIFTKMNVWMRDEEDEKKTGKK